jgi:hypothetical protein
MKIGGCSRGEFRRRLRSVIDAWLLITTTRGKTQPSNPYIQPSSLFHSRLPSSLILIILVIIYRWLDSLRSEIAVFKHSKGNVSTSAKVLSFNL